VAWKGCSAGARAKGGAPLLRGRGGFGTRRTRLVEAAGLHGRAGDGCAAGRGRERRRGCGLEESKASRRRGRELDEEGFGGRLSGGAGGARGPTMRARFPRRFAGSTQPSSPAKPRLFMRA
jgi:hypothetical protein